MTSKKVLLHSPCSVAFSQCCRSDQKFLLEYFIKVTIAGEAYPLCKLLQRCVCQNDSSVCRRKSQLVDVLLQAHSKIISNQSREVAAAVMRKLCEGRRESNSPIM